MKSLLHKLTLYNQMSWNLTCLLFWLYSKSEIHTFISNCLISMKYCYRHKEVCFIQNNMLKGFLKSKG